MSGVFISYRRSEKASAVAGRLFDRLVAEFGREQVFMDVDTIEPGADFSEAIQQAVGSCDVLLAVIDPGWLYATDAGGARRLDDPNDYVRIEVSEGLRRDARVVPVLVGGAAMPVADELPDDLSVIASHNAVTLTHERWRTDIEPLLAVARTELGRDRHHTIEAGERQSVAVDQASGADPSAAGASTVDLEPWTAVATESTKHSRTIAFRLSRDVHTLRTWRPPQTQVRLMNLRATLDGQKIRLRGSGWNRIRSTFLARDGTEAAEGHLLLHVSTFASRFDALHVVVAGRHVYAEGDNPPDRVWRRLK